MNHSEPTTCSDRVTLLLSLVVLLWSPSIIAQDTPKEQPDGVEQSSSSEWGTFIAQADEHLEAGRREVAAQTYLEAHRMMKEEGEPMAPAMLVAAAQLYTDLGQAERARKLLEQFYREALKMPDSDEANLVRSAADELRPQLYPEEYVYEEMMPNSLSDEHLYEESLTLAEERRKERERPAWPNAQGLGTGLEAHAEGVAGSSLQTRTPWRGGTFTLSLQLDVGLHESNRLLENLLFDAYNINVILDVLPRGPSNRPTLAWGIAPMLTNRWVDSRVRTATLLGALFPGVTVLRVSDDETVASLNWSLPIAMLLTNKLALQVRPRYQLILNPDDMNEMFVGVSMGLVATTQLIDRRPKFRCMFCFP